MDKIEALEKILDFSNKVKLMKPFEGRADLLRSFSRIYDMVNLHKSIMNYNYLCFLEARSLFNMKMKELEDSRKGG